MYSYARYQQQFRKLNNLIKYKLEDYQIKNNKSLNTSDMLCLSYQNVLQKNFYFWHIRYLYPSNSPILVLKLLDEKKLKFFIVCPENKNLFAKYIFSDEGIENSGLEALE